MLSGANCVMHQIKWLGKHEDVKQVHERARN